MYNSEHATAQFKSTTELIPVDDETRELIGKSLTALHADYVAAYSRDRSAKNVMLHPRHSDTHNFCISPREQSGCLLPSGSGSGEQ